jgi:hypothetical protein
MNEPDFRLRNALVAAGFLPVGVMPTETSEGETVMWDTWLSITHLHVPVIFRCVGHGGVVQPIYRLLARLASSKSAFRQCGLTSKETEFAYDVAVRLAPDVTEVSDVRVIRTDPSVLRQMMLAAPLVPWFDPAWYDYDDDDETDALPDTSDDD